MCHKCGESDFFFPEDKERIEKFRSQKCVSKKGGTHKVKVMPPKARCVHSTEIFMLSQLDSVYTIHELNSKLMQEARDEKEVKAQNEARKEI